MLFPCAGLEPAQSTIQGLVYVFIIIVVVAVSFVASHVGDERRTFHTVASAVRIALAENVEFIVCHYSHTSNVLELIL